MHPAGLFCTSLQLFHSVPVVAQMEQVGLSHTHVTVAKSIAHNESFIQLMASIFWCRLVDPKPLRCDKDMQQTVTHASNGMHQ